MRHEIHSYPPHIIKSTPSPVLSLMYSRADLTKAKFESQCGAEQPLMPLGPQKWPRFEDEDEKWVEGKWPSKAEQAEMR